MGTQTENSRCQRKLEASQTETEGTDLPFQAHPHGEKDRRDQSAHCGMVQLLCSRRHSHPFSSTGRVVEKKIAHVSMETMEDPENPSQETDFTGGAEGESL